MNYELAKKLRDAGFPNMDYRLEQFLKVGPSKLPTLSELIEACGDGFGVFYRWKGEYTSLSFTAWQKIGPECEGDGLWGEGSTPEEAVSKLWLALNAQKDTK